MNEIISSGGIKYIPRRITQSVRDAVRMFPVVVLTGARQVGKSTLLQHEFKDFAYLTMDDYQVMDRAMLDPPSLWKDKSSVIIDEVQKLPVLFHVVEPRI